MKILRTPDERFVGLPEFDFSPNYVQIPAGAEDAILRVHYLDEGPPQAAETVLLMHGEPSWSYLYRKMVAPLVDAGYRVVAPDLIGFGRSDKPSHRGDYTFDRHVGWMNSALIESLGLEGMTLVCQDWGGLIGLRLVSVRPERFKRVVAANTGLPTGDAEPSKAFSDWQRFSQEVEELPVGAIVDFGTISDLSREVIAAYDAPFPDESFKEGARQFPLLVPTRPDDPASAANRRAWQVLETFEKPFLCAFSDSDPITRGGDRELRARIPGCRDQSHMTIEGGGHFLQEDCGEAFARTVIEFVSADGAS